MSEITAKYLKHDKENKKLAKWLTCIKSVEVAKIAINFTSICLFMVSIKHVFINNGTERNHIIINEFCRRPHSLKHT